MKSFFIIVVKACGVSAFDAVITEDGCQTADLGFGNGEICRCTGNLCNGASGINKISAVATLSATITVLLATII